METDYAAIIAKARAGNIQAQWALGTFAVDPQGRPDSGRAAAIYWLKKAAHAGHEDAIRDLARYYDDPPG